jgi:hypothetical protein
MVRAHQRHFAPAEDQHGDENHAVEPDEPGDEPITRERASFERGTSGGGIFRARRLQDGQDFARSSRQRPGKRCSLTKERV